MSKLKIWSNGISMHTKIGVVDNDGRETPLTTVESIEFQMPKNGKAGVLRLGFVFGNEIEIEIPVDGRAATRLIGIGPAWADLRAALVRVPEAVSALLPPWVDQLIRAARAIASFED